MRDLLAGTRKILGEAPRHLEVSSRPLQAPPGTDSTHRAWAAHNAIWTLLHEGELVLGFVEMTDTRMFSPGTLSAFARVIWSAAAPGNLDDLYRVSAELEELSSAPAPPDHDTAAFADRLRDRSIFLENIKIPTLIARFGEVYLNCMTLYASLLPRRCLVSPFLPILVHAQKPCVAMVPSRYWGEDFLRPWLELGLDEPIV